MVAQMGKVELLKSIFNRGINKEPMNQYGVSVWGHVVMSRKVEAVRYLLKLEVSIATYAQEEREIQCELCKLRKQINNRQSIQRRHTGSVHDSHL